MSKVSDKTISWEAVEYVQKKRNTGWYIAIIVVALALTGVAIWLQQWSFVAIPILGAIALITMAVRPPRMLHYTLNKDGLTESEKLYPYENYKSFGVYKHDNIFSIVLIPHKRFATRIEVYFPQDKGEEIVDMFGARLPMEDVKQDFLDKIVKFLRF